MTEPSLDTTFVKENLNTQNLIGHIIVGGIKALVTTAVIIGAIISVLSVSNLPNTNTVYVYTAIIIGVATALLLAAHYYFNKLHRFRDVFYTDSIDKDENGTELIHSTIISVVVSAIFSVLAFIFGAFLGIIISVGISIGECSVASTLFIYYVFRNKLSDFSSYLVYAGYGIITGTAAYFLGVLVILAFGLLGFWLTVSILALETGFTAVYTYLGLLDWVNEEKNKKMEKMSWEENRKLNEESQEILRRLV